MSVRTYPAAQFGPTNRREFTTRQRIFIGGLGALTPIVLNLLVVDLQTTFQSMSPSVLVGWSFRALLLFYVGGLFSWLHKKEREPLRLFELGILAPTLLTAMINGHNSDPHNRPVDSLVIGAAVPNPQHSVVTTISLPQQEPVFSFGDPPRESIAQGFIRGLLGHAGRGKWFVHEKQSFASSAEAHARVRVLAKSDIQARVYEQGGPVPGFAVVLGDWLTDHDALRLQSELGRRNLQTSIWERQAPEIEPVPSARFALGSAHPDAW